MSAVEVRDRLGDRFRLLKGSDRRPERQQTLRLAVGWSYDLLNDDERELLRNASVFSGGFDLAGIVVGRSNDADDVDVLERLDSLVRKSLVVVNHAATHTRYGMFETIRQFAEEQLSATGGLERLRDRHAAHFGQEASARYAALERAGLARRRRLGGDRARQPSSAFRWSVERGELEVATDVAAHAALMGFSVQLFETVGWAEELLPAATAADVRSASPPVHGGGLRVLRRTCARPLRPTRTEPPSWKRRPATKPASPATPPSSRRSVRSTAATSIATSSSPACSGGTSAVAIAGHTGSLPTSTACSRPVGSTRRSI